MENERTNSRLHLNNAYQYLSKNNLTEAINELKKGLENYPGDIKILNLLGYCYYLRGKFEQAGTFWNRSISKQKEGNNASKYLQMMEEDRYLPLIHEYNLAINTGLRDNRHLEQILERLINEDEKLIEPYILMGVINLEKEEYEKAKFYFNKALSLDQNNINIQKYIQISDKEISRRKNKKLKNILTASVIGLLVLLVLALSQFYFNRQKIDEYQQVIGNYREEVSTQTDNIKEMTQKIDNLKNESNNLQQEYSQLQNKYNTLQEEYSNLQDANDNLKENSSKKYKSLQSEYSNLQDKYNNLQEESNKLMDKLNEKYSNLQGVHNVLQDSYNILQKEYDNFQKESTNILAETKEKYNRLEEAYNNLQRDYNKLKEELSSSVEKARQELARNLQSSYDNLNEDYLNLQDVFAKQTMVIKDLEKAQAEQRERLNKVLKDIEVIVSTADQQLFNTSIDLLRSHSYQKTLVFLKNLNQYSNKGYLNRETTFFLARIYERIARLDEAEKQYYRYIEIYPRTNYYDDSLYYLGLLLYDAGRIEESKRVLDKLVKEVPESQFNNSRVKKILEEN